MAVSVTYAEYGQSFADWLARGKRIVLGTLTLSTYSTSGMTCSIGGFVNFEAVFFMNTNGRTYWYDHTNSILRAGGGWTMSTSTTTFECASDTEAACFTAPIFLAVGRD